MAEMGRGMGGNVGGVGGERAKATRPDTSGSPGGRMRLPPHGSYRVERKSPTSRLRDVGSGFLLLAGKSRFLPSLRSVGMTRV
jgi:hypothetical protein